jgi:hypothetical protein
MNDEISKAIDKLEQRKLCIENLKRLRLIKWYKKDDIEIKAIKLAIQELKDAANIKKPDKDEIAEWNAR